MIQIPNASADDGQTAATELVVGEWHVDPTGNELRRNDEATRLEPKVIEVLVYLARNAGRVVGREELMSAVWPGVIVGDDALTQAIIKLRKALGDEARRPTYIETISKRGYRLIAPVTAARVATDATVHAPVAVNRRARVLLALAGTALAAALAALIVVSDFGARVGLSLFGADPTVISRPTVAVLPLVNQSGNPSREYFTDGMTEDIIHALGRFSGLGVMSRDAVERFKTRAAIPQAIKNELGVRYFVKGSVREADGRLRVTVELSDAEKGIVLWSDRYEGEGKDVFAIQDRIVKDIVGALAVKVTRLEEGRVASEPPNNLEAYDLALRARALLVSSNRVANRQARELLAKALRLDSEYAELYVLFGLAEVQRSLNYGWTEDPSEGALRAEQYLQKALAIDDPGTSARAHGLLSLVYTATGRFEKALLEADRAIELNPSDAFAFDTRGSTLMWLGRTEGALTAIETSLRFNPAGRDSGTGFNRALCYYTLRRYREAVEAAEATLARYPDTSFLHAIRAASHAQLGNQEEARSAAAQVMRFDPFFRTADFGNRFVNPRHTAHLQEGLRKAGL